MKRADRFLSAQPPRRPGLWVGLLLLLIYLLGYSGVYHSIDEQAALAVTESLLSGHGLRTDQMIWEQVWEPSQNGFGRDGHLHTKKGLGIPLLALPLLALGKAWPAVGAVQFALLLGPVLTGAAGAVLYRLARVLGYPSGTGLLLALAWGLAFPIHPYARTLFSEPLAALGLALGLYGAVAFRRRAAPPWRALLCAGGGLSLAVLARTANGVVLLPFAVYLLFVVLWERRQRPLAPGTLAQALAFSLPPLLTVALLSLKSWQEYGLLFGHPLDPVEGFKTPLGLGLRGLLLSSGKGLLWYLPPVLLIPWALAGWRRAGRLPDFLLAGAAFASSLLLYAAWWDWAGGVAWGPRLLIWTTPALALLLLPVLQRARAAGGWPRWLVGGLLLLSLLVQLPGVLVNTGQLENWQTYIGINAQARLWQWRFWPVASHWQALRDGFPEPLLAQAHFWARPLWLTAGTLLAAAIAAGGLALAWRLPGRRGPLPVAAVALLLLGLALPVAARGDPRWNEQKADVADNRLLWAYIDGQAGPGDVVILDMEPYYDLVGRTFQWMNEAPLPPYYLGWLRRETADTAAHAVLADWLPGYTRVWLSMQMTRPGMPEATTEAWLNGWAYRGRQQWLNTQRVVEFFVPGAGPARREEGPFFFGEGAALGEFSLPPAPGGDAFLVGLAWARVDDPALRYSVQALDGDGRVVAQQDGAPGCCGPAQADRIGLHAPGAQLLILKVYDGQTGAVQLFSNREGVLVGEYLVLQERSPGD